MTAAALFTDRTGLLGSTAGLLAGLPPTAVGAYLAARLLIPVLLIVYATRGATATQRVALVRDYLTCHLLRDHPLNPKRRLRSKQLRCGTPELG